MKAKVKAALLLLLALCLMLSGCGKSEAVRQAEEVISSIGEVTLQSKDSIEKAEAAYAALPPEERADVENYTVLKDARDAYDALVEQQNKKAIAAVEDKIDGLSDVTLDKKAEVEAARKAYDELGAALQERVSNAKILFDAEERIALLEEVTVTNFKSITCSKANMFDDVSYGTWFSDNDAAAVMALSFIFEGYSAKWLVIEDLDLTNMTICRVTADKRYDMLLPKDNGSIFYIQYWPESKKAQMGTKALSVSVSEYAAALKEAGIIEAYKTIPPSSIGNVLNAMG